MVPTSCLISSLLVTLIGVTLRSTRVETVRTGVLLVLVLRTYSFVDFYESIFVPTESGRNQNGEVTHIQTSQIGTTNLCQLRLASSITFGSIGGADPSRRP